MDEYEFAERTQRRFLPRRGISDSPSPPFKIYQLSTGVSMYSSFVVFRARFLPCTFFFPLPGFSPQLGVSFPSFFPSNYPAFFGPRSRLFDSFPSPISLPACCLKPCRVHNLLIQSRFAIGHLSSLLLLFLLPMANPKKALMEPVVCRDSFLSPFVVRE